MSQLTQKTIIEVTMHLVEQKSVKKITVRDIVEACGITRNTFYYYFHDIYEVLEYALAAGFERIGNENERFENFLGAIFRFCVKYQKVLYNLYHSVGYESLADYLKKQLCPHLLSHLQSIRTAEKDEKLLCVLYEEALVGTLMRWICNPRRTTDEAVIQNAIECITSYFANSLSEIKAIEKYEGEEDI